MADRQTESEQTQPTTIWQELETWAQTFKPWQRRILTYSVHFGRLTETQIDEVYTEFLQGNALAEQPETPIDVPVAITGRPTSVVLRPIRLTRMGNLRAINALPSLAALTFSPRLTVIYGGNGVGKSGFVRVLSNVCFSRTQHSILPNIYDEASEAEPGADLTITDDNQKETTLTFDAAADHAELKRVAVFDTAVARTHLVDQSPLGFKPAGFDVFPEMARVYRQLAMRLDADIKRRTKENSFVNSFVRPESAVSRLVASLSAGTDLTEVRRLAVFGETEQARIEEIQRQIRELQSKSPVEAIAQLEKAKREVATLERRLNESRLLLTDEKRAAYREQLADFTSKTREVAKRGADSFKRGFFKGIGSPEWENFLAAAYALGQVENPEYPRDDDHCLLCHRPLDPASAALIQRFWEFLGSEARREAEQAKARLDASVKALKALQLGFFSADTTVRAHVTRLNPALVRQIDEFIAALERDRVAIVAVLENSAGNIEAAGSSDVSSSLATLLEQIDADIARLREQKVEDAQKALETEGILLRHRQVLNQLLPEIETFVADLLWTKNASGAPRSSLNTRPLTDKETDLFATVIAENYRKRLARECQALDCNLPVEFRTRGDRGQTVRSLSIKGGHSPEKILSEGEQRAVALADFLTEVALNPANAGIILDDPVTSQDHQRKERIARRLVGEAKIRQVIIFTHDLVFLTMIAGAAADEVVEMLTHWVERDSEGRPGQVSPDDCPATTPQYRNTQKAQNTLAAAKSAAGSRRLQLIQRGMGELRRTVEELVPEFLLKKVVNRWADRIIVTGLKNVNWDQSLIDEIIRTYEDCSAAMEGHSHTEEKAGAPPELKDLEEMIARVNLLIKGAKKEKPK